MSRLVLAGLVLFLAIGAYGFVALSNSSFFTDGGIRVSLRNASKNVGFRVLVPGYLPKGMRFDSALAYGSPSQAPASIFLHYRGAGNELHIEQQLATGKGQPEGEHGENFKTERLIVKGAPAVLSTQTGGPRFSALRTKLSGISISIESSLSKNELLRVVKSMAGRE